MSESDSTTPTPSPKPVPRPAPPRGGAPSPAVLAGKKPSAPLLPAAPPVAEYDAKAIAAAKEFGSVAEDGTITVQDGTQVRVIGHVPGSPAEAAAAAEQSAAKSAAQPDGAEQTAGEAQAAPAVEQQPEAAEQAPSAQSAAQSSVSASDASEALEPYARGYLDLVAFLDLTQKKLAAPEHTHNELNRLLENLRKNMKEPKVVGDIPALRARAHELREAAKAEIAKLEEARAAKRAEATRRRIGSE